MAIVEPVLSLAPALAAEAVLVALLQVTLDGLSTIPVDVTTAIGADAGTFTPVAARNLVHCPQTCEWLRMDGM